MKKIIIWMTFLTVIGKILGIVRESVLASLWGTSYIVDAYLTAGAVGGIVFGWLLSVYVCYTPVYIEVCGCKSPEEGKKFTGNLISGMLIIYTILAVILFLTRVPLIELIVPGYSPEAKAATEYFLSIAAPSIMVVPIINLLKAYLDANQHFVFSLTTDSFFSSVQIAMIMMGGIIGAKFLAYALIIPFVLQLLMIIFVLKRFKMTVPLKLTYTAEIKKILHLLMPVCLSSIMTEVNSFVDKLFASSLSEGSVSILNYAFSLREAIMNVMMYAFITVSFPLLSRFVAEHSIDKLRCSVQNSIQMICVIFIPLSAGAAVLSKSAVELIYGRGNFGAGDVAATQEVLVLYLLAIVPIVLRTYLLKVFYAFQDTRISMLVGGISTITNVFLNGLLVGAFGRQGLVTATAVSEVMVLPILLASLKKVHLCLNLKKILGTFIKSSCSALLMGIVIAHVNLALPGGGKMCIIKNSLICLGLGIAVYYLTARLLKIEEAEKIGEWIKSKTRGMFQWKR